jgi:DNA polymerase III delta subunit
LYLDEFITRLGKETLPSAVLFSGEAEDIKVEALGRMKKSFRAKNPGGRLQYIDGGPSDFLAALDEARTASLFRETKLLVCLNAQKILQDATATESLGEYLLSPSEDHVLAMLSTGGRKNAKTNTALKRNAWTVECSPLAPWKALDWVLAEATAQGLRIPRDAAQALLDKTGCDVTRIRQAFEILEPFIRPRNSISLSDLTSVPLPGAEPEIFELLDAVGKRKADKALALLSLGGDERGGVVLLYGRVRELLAISGAKAKGLSQPAVAEELGLHPFRLKNLWEQASLFKVDELKVMLKELVEMQSAVLSGRLGKAGQTPALEAWILRRAGKRTN